MNQVNFSGLYSFSVFVWKVDQGFFSKKTGKRIKSLFWTLFIFQFCLKKNLGQLFTILKILNLELLTCADYFYLIMSTFQDGFSSTLFEHNESLTSVDGSCFSDSKRLSRIKPNSEWTIAAFRFFLTHFSMTKKTKPSTPAKEPAVPATTVPAANPLFLLQQLTIQVKTFPNVPIMLLWCKPSLPLVQALPLMLSMTRKKRQKRQTSLCAPTALANLKFTPKRS